MKRELRKMVNQGLKLNTALEWVCICSQDNVKHLFNIGVLEVLTNYLYCDY